ncbi:head GIN domain-containing protein [Tenacibaculum sp. SG-28]|uniref:head GIN domain-containing protein n=1 Tax=Tenacibaculum sp. SG-28 TaxID=754426 RepID=UPI000CF4764F|nr:head GIN domain-containing protein [Tenacibaculum sp. SG-28]PQJ23189.1 hypothetical protein BSU00_02880 [Tenacibaculum sp. SG-28]
MKKAIITLLICVTGMQTSNAQSWWNSKKVKGNGNLIKEKRNVEGFEAISLEGSFDVKLVSGNVGEITVAAEENLLPYIETYVRRNNLILKFKDNTNIRATEDITIVVPFNSLDAISLGGSGNIESFKAITSNSIAISIGGSGNIKAIVDAKEISTAIGGSGNIILKGKTETLDCAIAGSGNIKAYDLETDKVNASIAGSGDILTYVNKILKASVIGSGSIYYKGKPEKIDSNSLGSGDVINRN